MKKLLLVPIFLISLVCGIFMSACVDTAPTEGQYFTVTYIAGENGRISGIAEQSVKAGEDGTKVTAVPNENYVFVKWSDNITEATRQDKNVTEDVSVTAIFEKFTYNLSYVAGEGGYLLGNVNQSILYGENGTEVTAVPNEGYSFVTWSDGLTEAARQDKNVTENISVTAIFEKQTYTLNYVAGDGGYLLGNANQTVAYGENGTKVTAIPNDGYKFVKWSDGETKDTRCDTEVNSDVSATAEFEFLFAGGKGTQLNPYKIDNYTQLLNMRYYPDKCYMLSCDLDLSGVNHEPIFDANEYFAGIFFGNGKTIKNLTVETESNFPSLFGMVMGGIITDLNLENVSITTTDYNTQDEGMQYYVGTLAGYFAGRIDNVSVSGKITVDGLNYDGVAVGGFVGRAIGTIRDCNVDVQIDVKNVFREHNAGMNLPFIFGGMLGIGNTVNMQNCITEGEIHVTECFWLEEDGILQKNRYTDILIGGMVGYYFTGRQAETYIKDCKTDISIFGDNHYNAGGFVGYLEVNQNTSMIISNCSVLGDITIGVVGGFICNGYTDGELLIEGCYTDCEITGYSRAAGFLKTYSGATDKCIVSNCYSLSNIKTHNVFDSEEIGGEAWGFGYQISDVNFVNCYSSGDIYSNRGGGFIWALSYGKIYGCYSDCNITLFASTGSSVFTYNLRDTEVENCYSISNVVYDSQTKQNAINIIGHILNGKINSFYYAGNSIGNVIRLIEDTKINNFHVLRTISTEDLIGEDRGETPSPVNITAYETKEEMYFLANKLNEGQDEEIWVNIENGLPELKFEIKNRS